MAEVKGKVVSSSLGLKFSIENDIFKPRMNISSENEHFVPGGMVFFPKHLLGQYFPSKGTLGGKSSLRGKIVPLRDNFPFKTAFSFPWNAPFSKEMKVGKRDFYGLREKFDFPPQGKIYLKPFFCLKRCYGFMRSSEKESFRSLRLSPLGASGACPKSNRTRKRMSTIWGHAKGQV